MVSKYLRSADATLEEIAELAIEAREHLEGVESRLDDMHQEVVRAGRCLRVLPIVSTCLVTLLLSGLVAYYSGEGIAMHLMDGIGISAHHVSHTLP